MQVQRLQNFYALLACSICCDFHKVETDIQEVFSKLMSEGYTREEGLSSFRPCCLSGCQGTTLGLLTILFHHQRRLTPVSFPSSSSFISHKQEGYTHLFSDDKFELFAETWNNTESRFGNQNRYYFIKIVLVIFLCFKFVSLQD